MTGTALQALAGAWTRMLTSTRSTAALLFPLCPRERGISGVGRLGNRPTRACPTLLSVCDLPPTAPFPTQRPSLAHPSLAHPGMRSLQDDSKQWFRPAPLSLTLIKTPLSLWIKAPRVSMAWTALLGSHMDEAKAAWPGGSRG